MKTLEQQIKSLGCGVHAVELDNKGVKKAAIVNCPSDLRKPVTISVLQNKTTYQMSQVFKVKGDGIKLLGQSVANEHLLEVWEAVQAGEKHKIFLN